MTESFEPSIKAIDDIYYRFVAQLPITGFNLRESFQQEWKVLEERIEKERLLLLDEFCKELGQKHTQSKYGGHLYVVISPNDLMRLKEKYKKAK